MSAAPVGSAMPNTRDKSLFPRTRMTCRFTAGATSENPELPGARMFAKYVGTSTSSSRQGAIPGGHLVWLPSIVRPPPRALTFTPFSLCRLPTGTTMLEFVTSGRSVAISSLAVGQASARASTAARLANADSKPARRVRLRMKTLDRGKIEAASAQARDNHTAYFAFRRTGKFAVRRENFSSLPALARRLKPSPQKQHQQN